MTDDPVLCEHAVACGGCPLIDRTYGEQLDAKASRVRTSVARYSTLASSAVRATAPADPRTAYRTRAKLMVAPGGRVGLFGVVGDHEVVDTAACRVLAPALARVLAVLRPMIAKDERASQGGPLAPQPAHGAGGLLAIDLRELRGPSALEGDDSRVLVTLVIARTAQFRLERLRAAAVALAAGAPEVLGVAVNFHEGDAPQVLGQETLLLAGQAWGEDTVGASTHRATFGSFVQAHRGQAAYVHAKIAESVFGAHVTHDGADRPRVLDLYGGSGAIALGLAKSGADVVMVESFGPAVDQARESARACGLGTTFTAERADVADALARLARSAKSTDRFDVTVVNPPRRGLDPVVRTRLAESPTDSVIYVSCQPETLARDLDHLARLGLVADAMQPIDMIPLTLEVETLVVLTRGPLAPPVVLYEDREVLVVLKAPHEPTIPQGEYHGSLLGRVQRLPGGAEAVPVHRLDVGTSGVVVFAKSPLYVAAWGKALQADDATKTYIAAVRGIPTEKGVIDRPLTIEGKTKSARTHFERARMLGTHALLTVLPDEGRTHQIRRHLAAIGHPVLGDARYGHAPTNRYFQEKHGLDRTFLHAARLELTHPSTRKKLAIEAPLSGDLESVLESLASARPGPRPAPRRVAK